VHGNTDMCKTFHITNNTFVSNEAEESGGVLAWNFNDDQTYSPCKYCGKGKSFHEDCVFIVRHPPPSVINQHTMGAQFFFSLPSPLHEWHAHHANTVSVWCRAQANVAPKRSETSTPLVNSIFVSSNHWYQNSSSFTDTTTSIISQFTNSTFSKIQSTNNTCVVELTDSLFPTITVRRFVFPLWCAVCVVHMQSALMCVCGLALSLTQSGQIIKPALVISGKDFYNQVCFGTGLVFCVCCLRCSVVCWWGVLVAVSLSCANFSCQFFVCVAR